MNEIRSLLIFSNRTFKCQNLVILFSQFTNIIEAKDKEEVLFYLNNSCCNINCVIINDEKLEDNEYEIVRTIRNQNSLIPLVVFSEKDDEKILLNLGVDLVLLDLNDSKMVLQLISSLMRKYDFQKTGLNAALSKASKQEYEKINNILENTIGGIVFLEVNENKIKLLYANKEYYKIFGYQKRIFEEEYDSEKNFIGYEALEKIKDSLLMETEKIIVNDVETTKEDGTKIWLQIKGVKVKRDIYHPNTILLVVTDVTRVKLIERDVSNNESKLSALISNIPAGILLQRYEENGDITVLYYNDFICNMLRYTREELDEKIKNYLSLIDMEDRKRLASSMHEAARKRENFIATYRYIRKDGSYCFVQSTTTKIEAYQDEYIVYTIVVDISGIKETERLNIEINKELKYRADNDALTGVYNRAAFIKITEQLLKDNLDDAYNLVVLNIEKFKVLNEVLGPASGDKVLKAIAEYFSRRIKLVGTYGRLEADHFVFCAPKDIIDPEYVLAVLDEIVDELDINYKIKFNLGIYCIHDVTVPVEKMIDRASIAIEKIKGNYNTSYYYYDENIRISLLEEQEIISEMNEAIEEEQFVVYYQPIYSYSSLLPISAEALVRWLHPKKGLIPPSKFIPIFEKNGFITRLDYYVWENVCLYLRKRLDDKLPVVPISVNVSRLSLYNINISKNILDLTKKYNLDPKYLKLEITESAYTDNPHLLQTYTKELQLNGFNIAMDDFGSGYSSLNMLKDVPVNILKLDLKFLGDMKKSNRSGNILASIIRMAKWLNMTVIAEGVETKAQANFLSSIGCDYHQGYYYGRPMPIVDFNKILDKKLNKNANSEILDSNENKVFVFDSNFLKDFYYENVFAVAAYYYENGILEAFKINEKYYEVLGYTPQDFLEASKNIIKTIYPDDISKFKKAVEEAIKTKKEQKLIVRHYNVNRKILTLDATIIYLGSKGKNAIISAAFQDITKPKR